MGTMLRYRCEDEPGSNEALSSHTLSYIIF